MALFYQLRRDFGHHPYLRLLVLAREEVGIQSPTATVHFGQTQVVCSCTCLLLQLFTREHTLSLSLVILYFSGSRTIPNPFPVATGEEKASKNRGRRECDDVELVYAPT